jgi:transposase
MEHRFKEPNRDQMVLRPTDFDDMLEDDHPARAVWEFVSRLQMGEMEEKYAAYEGKAGRTPFSPRLLLALWLYAYTDGVFSCRRLEEHCVKDLAYIWLCGGIEPNYHTLSDFRSAHTEEFNGLFTKALAIMSQAGLIDLDEIFQDGSKVQANASLESGRDKRGLEKLREKAREVVERLDGMSEAKKMELGKKKASARQRAARERLERLEKAMEEYPEREERRKKKGLDPSRTQISVTDPECQKMKHRDGSYKESYNAQAAIDGLEGVIVGVSVSNSSADAHQLTGMVEDVEKRLGGSRRTG